MNSSYLKLLIFSLIVITGCSGDEDTDISKIQDQKSDARIQFAKCLSGKGWSFYSSVTCAACVAQKDLFGAEAVSFITEIECNPHAENANVELCINKNIIKTPTWILEENSKEIKRIEKYQLLSELSRESGCSL